MTRLGRLITWPVRAAIYLRYGTDRAICPYCLDQIRTGRLDTHIYIDHAEQDR
jgi:hypothetical protein